MSGESKMILLSGTGRIRSWQERVECDFCQEQVGLDHVRREKNDIAVRKR